MGVFLLHVFFAKVLKLYGPYPHLDVPMHLLGGIAMAYFLSRCFSALPEGVVTPGSSRRALEAIAVTSLTATGAVFWEFAEFISDRFFGCRAQGGLQDTMGDLAVGILGATLYALIAWRRGALGRVDPIDRPEGMRP
jgi:hypothetical protein